jgi:hypothetical protein
MSLVRILRTVAVTVTHTFTVDETPTDAAGTVTATLKRLDGTVVNTAAAGHPGPPGVYTYAVPPQASLDWLTLDWSGTLGGSSILSVQDRVEIVGGFLFGAGEARAAHRQTFANHTTWPTVGLATKAVLVEEECEGICRQAFVPRFARAVLSGTGSDRLTIPQVPPYKPTMLRSLRAVIVGGVAWSAPDVAAVGLSDSGVLTRPGGAAWPAGQRNIVIEYEHGWDLPPEEIRDAGILRLRSRLTSTSSGIPDRASSFTVVDGGVYRLSTPDRQRTGIPDVDAAYARYTRPRRAVFA